MLAGVLRLSSGQHVVPFPACAVVGVQRRHRSAEPHILAVRFLVPGAEAGQIAADDWCCPFKLRVLLLAESDVVAIPFVALVVVVDAAAAVALSEDLTEVRGPGRQERQQGPSQ